MPLPFPFPLTPKLRKIKKLVRDPLASIRKWCYDKKKTITTDPLKNKKKITKELKLNGTYLQRVITLISNKVDEIIDHLNGIEDLERMIIAEVKQRQQENIRIEKEYKEADKELEELIKREIAFERRARENADRQLENRLTIKIDNLDRKLTNLIEELSERHDLDLKKHRAETIKSGYTNRPIHNIRRGNNTNQETRKGGPLSSQRRTKPKPQKK
tara:strand:+ start:874 stop:1518 length:645 start_codon:yes stop_codon:yes gene_type:complete